MNYCLATMCVCGRSVTEGDDKPLIRMKKKKEWHEKDHEEDERKGNNRGHI